MTFTYSGDPSFSDLDQVRFYLGDTTEADSYITDEEITFLIDSYSTQYGHLLGVAALGAEMMAAKVSRQVTVSADGVSVALSELQQRFNELAASLRSQYQSLNLSGTSFTSLDDITLLDPTIPALTFGIGFTDNPEAGQQDYGREGSWLRAEG